MSLDNIQLSGIALQELYKKSLVEVKSKKADEKKSASAALNILGKNLKNIILIVRNNEAAFLTDEEELSRALNRKLHASELAAKLIEDASFSLIFLPLHTLQKKVMMKFRTMLKNEDFENLFRDPLIGDFL